MERRDWIIDEMQKFGLMVMGLIGKLAKRSESLTYNFSFSMADQEFESEAGFSLRMLAEMNPASLDAFIQNHPELNPANLELLADLLIELSDDPGCDPAVFLSRANDLLVKATNLDKTFSAEREGKTAFIASRLQRLNS
jgi:hypothetical protein